MRWVLTKPRQIWERIKRGRHGIRCLDTVRGVRQVSRVDVAMLRRTLQRFAPRFMHRTVTSDVLEVQVDKDGAVSHRAQTVVTYLRQLGVPETKLTSLVERNARILSYDPKKKIAETVQFLLELGVKQQDVAKILARFPPIVGYSIENKMIPIMQFLNGIGISGSQFGRILTRSPSIIGCSIEEKLKPTVEYLNKVLGIPLQEFSAIVSRHPQILGLSVRDNLQRTVMYYESMGLTKEDIALLVRKQPAVLSYSVENNLKLKVKFLNGCGFTDEQLAIMIKRCPGVLSASITTNLIRKIEYLQMVMEGELEELVEFPHYVTYSLNQRIKPRFTLLQEQGLRPKLSAWLPPNDEVFAKRFLSGKPPKPRAKRMAPAS